MRPLRRWKLFQNRNDDWYKRDHWPIFRAFPRTRLPRFARNDGFGIASFDVLGVRNGGSGRPFLLSGAECVFDEGQGALEGALVGLDALDCVFAESRLCVGICEERL